MQPPEVARLESELFTSIRELQRRIEDEIDGLLEVDVALGGQVRLLESIPGIARRSAVAFLATVGAIERFESSSQVCSFLGLHPSRVESGKTKFASRLSKAGDPRVRKGWWMATLAAMRFNPACKALAERLRSKGLHSYQVRCAIMNKLARQCFGVLKSGKLFDSALSLPK